MPETYFVSQNSKEESMIKILRDEFDKKVTAEMYERAKQMGIPMKNIITMASIVEKESMKPEERAVIAGIFYNRLKMKIRLESCATVLYAMGVNKPNLSIADTKYPSPYNTYLHYGLPPGPITNPGIESIKAALYPVSTDNLFFVAIGGGQHLFSPNLEQHVRNKVEAKARQQEQKAAAAKSNPMTPATMPAVAVKKKAPAPQIDRKAAEEATRALEERQLAATQSRQNRTPANQRTR
jgi:UPF0755 protein